jgi:hypothetical protein
MTNRAVTATCFHALVDFPREALTTAVSSLAEQGVYVGTSSWKYEGWLGLIYSPDRYRTHTKFSRGQV